MNLIKIQPTYRRVCCLIDYEKSPQNHEKFSKEDIANLNQGIVNIIKQVLNNKDINIQDIEV